MLPLFLSSPLLGSLTPFAFRASPGEGLGAAAAVFLAALAFRWLAKARFDACRSAIAERPGSLALRGALVAAIAVVLGTLFAVSLIGLTLAGAIFTVLGILWVLGLAVGASVLGAALPIESLKDRELAQTGVGVGLAYLIGLVPLLGALLTSALALAGLGALFGGARAR